MRGHLPTFEVNLTRFQPSNGYQNFQIPLLRGIFHTKVHKNAYSELSDWSKALKFPSYCSEGFDNLKSTKKKFLNFFLFLADF